MTDRPLRIYVASSWRCTRYRGVVAGLRTAGFDVYDFREQEPGDHGFSWRQVCGEPPPWTAKMTRHVLQYSVVRRGFALDFVAMKWCDALVLVQPCGRSASLEAGWASGAGKLTIALLADGEEPELMLRLLDYLVVDLDEAISILRCAADHDDTLRLRLVGEGVKP